MTEDSKHIHCLVKGRVQGVFFRASTQEEARRLGLNGWVRNCSDSRVEIFASGKADHIQTLIEWLRQGPPMARVDDIEFIQEKFGAKETVEGFLIR